ncbi:MAG: pyridoxal-phosphate dependent enzyme [Rhodobacteraceae bacterium]|nr:pyridoxal-phosphate dependent enzyme [Paracoccaceae bacterium]
MKLATNPYRGTGVSFPGSEDVPFPSIDSAASTGLVARCPRAAETPLLQNADLATRFGIARLDLKDERDRMGLGSFKALGAAYVIARDAEAGKAKGRTYVTASAGNHGLSVAAGAQAFGARAVIYLSEQVPQAFADRLTGLGAEVVRAGETYEASMEAAAEAATSQGYTLLSDSSWPGYTGPPFVLMEGYLILMEEVFTQIDAPPTHIFLQAGVGGLAGAAAALARVRWGDDPRIVVVEPEWAPALAASIKAGAPVTANGPVSAMGRLDCKEPSLIALKGLSRDADLFATISEEEGQAGADLCAEAGLPSTPSGAAGLAALAASGPLREALSLDASSRALVILSEGPE